MKGLEHGAEWLCYFSASHMHLAPKKLSFQNSATEALDTLGSRNGCSLVFLIYIFCCNFLHKNGERHH